MSVNKQLVHETVSTIGPKNIKESLGSSFEGFEVPALCLGMQAPLVGDSTFTVAGPNGSTPMWAS